MKLTKTERAMLSNQNRILALLDESNSKSYLLKAEIAERGYEGLYHELFDIIGEGISEEVCNETHEILTMYRVINNCIASLTPEQKEQLDLEKIKFNGFDANNDEHYGFMRFIVENVDLYEEYKGTYLNSHSISTISKYRRILNAYERAINKETYELSKDGLQTIIDAI